MRVLFVYPNVRGLYMLPPAVAILSAVLKEAGHECRLFDTTYWFVPEAGADSEAHKEKHLHVKPYEKNVHEVSLKLGADRAIVSVRSGSGDVTLTVPKGTQGRIKAKAGSGQVNNSIPQSPDAPLRLEAYTGSGKITLGSY